MAELDTASSAGLGGEHCYAVVCGQPTRLPVLHAGVGFVCSFVFVHCL